MAMMTQERSPGCRVYPLIIAPLYIDGLAVNQGVCHDLPCLLNNTPKGRPGHPHLFACFFVGDSQKVSQPEGFELIDSQLDLF
jgi:hypothetical protein